MRPGALCANPQPPQLAASCMLRWPADWRPAAILSGCTRLAENSSANTHSPCAADCARSFRLRSSHPFPEWWPFSPVCAGLRCKFISGGGDGCKLERMRIVVSAPTLLVLALCGMLAAQQPAPEQQPPASQPVPAKPQAGATAAEVAGDAKPGAAPAAPVDPKAYI